MAGFPKGQSGNPGGRPAGLAEVRKLARAHTEEAIKTLAHVMQKSRDDRVRVVAATALLDRAWGKPVQPIAGEDGGPIPIAPSQDVLALLRSIVDKPSE